MAVEKTPWFIGANGVTHSAEVARQLAYAATGGTSGVIGAGDCKVVPMSVPGAGVMVLPGGVAMLNNYPGGGQQSYIGRVPSAELVPVAPTTTQAGRSDLVIARVRDPQYGSYGSFNPGSPNGFPFFSVETLQGVPAGTRYISESYPAFALARIDIPPSTGTITGAMITDLREKTMTRQKIVTRMQAPESGLIAAPKAYKNWPEAPTLNIEIPVWATQVTMIVNYSGIGMNGPVVVGTRGKMGSYTDMNHGIMYKSTSGYDRQSFVHISEMNIPPAMRGTVQTFAVEAQKTTPAGDATLDYQTTIGYTFHFEEVAE